MDLGKLIRTTNKKCPKCFAKNLQIREVRGKQVLQCSCGYDERIEKPKTHYKKQKRGEIELENFGE